MSGAQQSEAASRSPDFRRAVWRWHFYAGLFAAPILLVLSITGALYLFQREIDHWWNRDLDRAAIGAVQHPLFHQEEMIGAAYPGAVLRSVRLPDAPDRATKWLVTLPEGDREIFLDQYAGKINGARDPAWQPMTIARKLHGTLLAGDAGSYVVELVACWTLVMLLTGTYLWWPQRWQIGGVVTPRLKATGRRFWRDLHAVPSIFNALLVAFLILTGLPWSAFWGVQFSRIGEVAPLIAPSPNFSAHLSHTVTAVAGDGQAKPMVHDHNHGTAQLPWVIQNTPAPSGHGAEASSIVAAEQHLGLLDMAKWGTGTTIFYPRDSAGTFMVSFVPAKAQGQRTLYVNPGDGKILRNVGWSDYSAAGKATEWGVLTHMGRQYGLINQIAGLLVCLTIVGGVVAGINLWWRRRPKGALGEPPLEADERLPPVIGAGIGVIAVLFPLVGASLLLLWLARKAMRLIHPVGRGAT